MNVPTTAPLQPRIFRGFFSVSIHVSCPEVLHPQAKGGYKTKGYDAGMNTEITGE